ncbi:MAG: ribose 5-phosphate isomerase B [Acidobacteriota bacterium]|jgi:ribose 5-phosphate isomerase B|nr:ribose 5-phosphate isomerase B [Acidobacteriota bacterium]MDQ3374386.1 ribose 5-phosphate isomerase B [Acidobacteriota bacterium]
MSENNETRERVRALVKEVLANVPVEEEKAPETLPKHIVVNSLKDELGKEFDRDESAKNLIAEDDLRGLESGARLRVADDAKFTPLANDIIREKQIILIKKSSRRSSTKVQSIAVGCDHGGFQFKEQLKSFLSERGFQVRDFGTDSEEAVDYPDFAYAVATAVSEKKSDMGIIIDGAGIGSAIAANKVFGVRAAACYNAALAKNSREHNGANVLTLGSGQNSFSEIKEIVEAFLTNDLTEERHKKRVAKIEAIERQYKY